MSLQFFLWQASVVKQPVQQRPLSQSQIGKISQLLVTTGFTFFPNTSPISVIKYSVGLPYTATTLLHFSSENFFIMDSMTAQEQSSKRWKSWPKQRMIWVLLRMRLRKLFQLLRLDMQPYFEEHMFSLMLPPMNWSSKPWMAHLMCVGSAPQTFPLLDLARQMNSVLFFRRMCSSDRSTKNPSTPRCARMASVDCECPKESAETATRGKQPNSSFKKCSPSSQFSMISSQQAHPQSCSTYPPPKIYQYFVFKIAFTFSLSSLFCSTNHRLKNPISELKKVLCAFCVLLLTVSLNFLLSQSTFLVAVKMSLTEVKRFEAKYPWTAPQLGFGSQQLSKSKIQQASR